MGVHHGMNNRELSLLRRWRSGTEPLGAEMSVVVNGEAAAGRYSNSCEGLDDDL